MDGNKMPWGESMKLECSNKHEDIVSLMRDLLKNEKQ